MMEENNAGARGERDVSPQSPQTYEPAQGQAPAADTAAQQPAKASFQPGVSFQPAQPDSYPVPPYTQQQVNNLDGKATGALVCGILSILLCSTVVIGVILGIVAIVLGAQVAGRMVSADRARVGKVCGIVGLVLSILFGVFFALFIAAILNVGTHSGAFGGMADGLESTLSSSSSSEDSAVRQAADDTMAGMRDMDADKQAKLAKKLDTGFEDTAGMGLSQTGVDPKELVSWLVSDMSYDIDTVDVQGSTATVYVTVNSRDVDGFTDMVEQDMDAYMGSRTYNDVSSLSEVYTKMGEFMRSAMAQTGNSQKMISLDLSNEDGTWTVDESSLAYAAYEIYGLGSL